MKQILLVCGAGASSAFIAQRVRRVAQESDSSVALSASSLELLPNHSPDVVYLGPHLADAVDMLHRTYPSAKVVVMSKEEYADPTGRLLYLRLREEIVMTTTKE